MRSGEGAIPKVDDDHPPEDRSARAGDSFETDPGPDDFDGVTAPWDGRRVPVVLLGGYLGAGKTTVLNEMLARTDQPIAVFVNDVGRVNIDAALIARHDGETIELTDGCVCCSLAGGLVAAFGRLRARPEPPELVVVELSGVAVPNRVAPWASSTGFRLDGVVVLADASTIAAQVTDPSVGPLVRTQLEAADLVLVTKADLVDADGLQHAVDVVSDIAQHSSIHAAPTPHAAAGLVALAERRPGGPSDTAAQSLFDVHTVDTMPIPEPISRLELEQLLDALPASVVRAKGIVRLANDVLHSVQVVGSRQVIEPLTQAELHPATDLVIITVVEGPH